MKNNQGEEHDFDQKEEMFVKCKVKREYITALDGGKFKPKHSSVVQITKSKIKKYFYQDMMRQKSFDNLCVNIFDTLE